MRAWHALNMIADDVLDRLDQQAEGCTDGEYRLLVQRIVDLLCKRLAKRRGKRHERRPKQ